MSIENLEKTIEINIEDYNKGETVSLVPFMLEVIETFKDQSDQIADLRKYIAETLIDYDNIKIGGND